MIGIEIGPLELISQEIPHSSQDSPDAGLSDSTMVGRAFALNQLI